jgi:hypothetical protein
MTVIYFDKDAPVARPRNKAQENDLAEHLPGAAIGQVADTPLTPVVFSYEG